MSQWTPCHIHQINRHNLGICLAICVFDYFAANHAESLLLCRNWKFPFQVICNDHNIPRKNIHIRAYLPHFN